MKLKLIAALVCLALAAGSIGAVVWWASNTQARVDRAERETERAQTHAAGESVQKDINRAGQAALERIVYRDRIIRVEAANALQQIELADQEGVRVAPLLAAWGAGIDRVRDAAAAARSDRAARGDSGLAGSAVQSPGASDPAGGAGPPG